MKLTSLSLLTVLFFVCSYSAQAQYAYSPTKSFSISKTVTYEGDELDAYIYFHNNSASPVKIIWRLLEDSIPAEWSIGLCDNVACYYNVNNSLEIGKITDTIPAGDSIFLKGVFDAHCTGGNGWMKISAKVEDGSFILPDTLLYSASAIAECPNAIIETDAFASLQVFPNPATDVVTISSTMLLTQPLKIQLTDLQGRVVSRPSSLKINSDIDIRSLSAGSYLLQVLDMKGQVVAVRRIFKQ